MYKITQIITIVLSISFSVVLISCNNEDPPIISEYTAEKASKTEFIKSNITKPDFNFLKVGIFDIGKLYWPIENWETKESSIYNKTLGMTVSVLNHEVDATKSIDDYLFSYNNENSQQSSDWISYTQEYGRVNNIETVRCRAQFDIDTLIMRSRDYLFFTNNGVTIIQCRFPLINEDGCSKIIDYMVINIK